MPVQISMTPFEVERQSEDHNVRVIVRGEAAESGSPRTLVIDLRDVTCFDSTGLQVLLDAEVRSRGTERTLVVLPGSVLGWIDDPKLVDVPFALERGESLVLYTDGVTEARTAGDAYGEEGLESLLPAAAGDDASTIAARIDRAAARAGGRRDDVAVLVTCVRRAGSA